MDNLDTLLSNLKNSTEKNTKIIYDHSDELKTITNELRKVALKNEIRALAKQLEIHTDTIQLCARVAAVDMVSQIQSFYYQLSICSFINLCICLFIY